MAKFTNKDLRLKDGQKVTFGTDLDSNMWYDGTANQLRVDTTISGVDPTEDYHLTTRFYVDDTVGSGVANVAGDLTALSGSLSTVAFSGAHSDLTGLDADDHTQYVLVDGSRGFASTVSGVSPILDGDLATKGYIDTQIDALSSGIVLDHGGLTGLGDDDHAQYILVDGTRAFTNTVGGITPVADSDLTTKQYVDSLVQGLDWQESVLNMVPVASGTTTEGTRYIASETGGGWTENYIYEYTGSTWSGTAPTEGMSTWVEGEDALYVYNGTDWVMFGSTITHNNTSGKQGGTTNEYYHLTSDEYTSLTSAGGVENASDMHIHDDRYYTETEVDATISGIQSQIDNLGTSLSSDYVTLDTDQTITGNKTFDNAGTTTFLGDVFFNGIEITMSGTTLNTESNAVFNYDSSTTINNSGTTNYTSTATVDHESGSTETFESGSETVHESGSNDTYQSGSNLTFSGTNVTVTGDTTIDYGPNTIVNNEGTTNFESGSETIFYPGSSVTFSGTTNFVGTVAGISHSDLEGLSADDHTQYILVDGSRGFTGTVSGVAPVLGNDLATKAYVDAQGLESHGRTAVADQASSVTVNFTDLGHINYTVNVTLENTTDSPPSIYPFIVSGKTSSSFTCTFAGDMDSANYYVNWTIIED